MSKLFTVAGTSRKNSVVKVRWANDVKREKALEKDGQTDIILVELPEPMTKIDSAKLLLTLPMYHSGDAYDAVVEFLTGEGVTMETIMQIGADAGSVLDETIVEEAVDEEVVDEEVVDEEVVDEEVVDEEAVDEEAVSETTAPQISEEDQEMLKTLMQYA